MTYLLGLVLTSKTLTADELRTFSPYCILQWYTPAELTLITG